MARPDDDDPYWDQPAEEEDYRRMTYAGFWTRFVAALLDGLILAVPSFAVGFVVGIFGMSAGLGPLEIQLISQFLGVLIGWLYAASMESSSNQGTLGKMALGIKVTDMNGRRISFGQASGRHFAKILSGIILLIGYIMAAFTEKKQALHDLIAGTLVVRK